MAVSKRVGILTAGGASPGLNAAIRGFGKAAIGTYGVELVGFRDGFRGLAENRRVRLDKATLSNILTVGGTILGTSRDKPHRMLVDGEVRDTTEAIVGIYRRPASAPDRPAAGPRRAPGVGAAPHTRADAELQGSAPHPTRGPRRAPGVGAASPRPGPGVGPGRSPDRPKCS